MGRAAPCLIAHGGSKRMLSANGMNNLPPIAHLLPETPLKLRPEPPLRPGVLTGCRADIGTGQAGPLPTVQRDRLNEGAVSHGEVLRERLHLHPSHERPVSAGITVEIQESQVLISGAKGRPVIPKVIGLDSEIPSGADELGPASGIADLAGGSAVGIQDGMSTAGMVREITKAVVGVDDLVRVNAQGILDGAFGLADSVHVGPHHRPEDIALAQPSPSLPAFAAAVLRSRRWNNLPVEVGENIGHRVIPAPALRQPDCLRP